MNRLLLVLLAACGDNAIDPLAGLVRVTGPSPFATDCNGAPQAGTNGRGLEVEPWLVVDPANPQHLVGAWQQDRWSSGGANGIVTGASFDGGRTWTHAAPMFSHCEGGPYQRATDPWLAFTPGGALYAIGAVFDNSDPDAGLEVARSLDGGVTWGAPFALEQETSGDVFNDKDSITADPTVPDRVFATWDRITGQSMPTKPIGTGPTLLAIGTGGVWDTPRTIFDPGVDAQTIGNVIVVLPDGTVIDSFAMITSESSANPIAHVAVIRSTDHGETWSPPIEVAALNPIVVHDAKHDVDVRSGGILPQIAVDPTSGRVYVAWEDAGGGSVEGIMLASSSDGGLTWTAPRQVNQVPAANAFDPVVAARADGTIGVLYYDTRDDDPDDDSSFEVAAWLVTSADQGATWTEEAITGPFDLQPARIGTSYFLGDYQGLGVAGDAFVPFLAVAGSADDPSDIVVRPVPW